MFWRLFQCEALGRGEGEDHRLSNGTNFLRVTSAFSITAWNRSRWVLLGVRGVGVQGE
jgi:hypothetical protein